MQRQPGFRPVELVVGIIIRGGHVSAAPAVLGQVRLERPGFGKSVGGCYIRYLPSRYRGYLPARRALTA